MTNRTPGKRVPANVKHPEGDTDSSEPTAGTAATKAVSSPRPSRAPAKRAPAPAKAQPAAAKAQPAAAKAQPKAKPIAAAPTAPEPVADVSALASPELAPTAGAGARKAKKEKKTKPGKGNEKPGKAKGKAKGKKAKRAKRKTKG